MLKCIIINYCVISTFIDLKMIIIILEAITCLKGHAGLVKGIAWDPVGKYLASQSDDRTIRIWSRSNWTCTKVIDKPFQEVKNIFFKSMAICSVYRLCRIREVVFNFSK